MSVPQLNADITARKAAFKARDMNHRGPCDCPCHTSTTITHDHASQASQVDALARVVGMTDHHPTRLVSGAA